MLAVFSLRDASGTVSNGGKMYIPIKYKVLAVLPYKKTVVSCDVMPCSLVTSHNTTYITAQKTPIFTCMYVAGA